MQGLSHSKLRRAASCKLGGWAWWHCGWAGLPGWAWAGLYGYVRACAGLFDCCWAVGGMDEQPSDSLLSSFAWPASACPLSHWSGQEALVPPGFLP